MRFKTEIEVVVATDYDCLEKVLKDTQANMAKQIEELELELKNCAAALDSARVQRDKLQHERDKAIELCKQLKFEMDRQNYGSGVGVTHDELPT